MAILYIETNFIIGIAKGQDPLANRLLENPPPSLHIVIPHICFVEALARWKDEERYSKRFSAEIKVQINEARRDLTSSTAASLVTDLEAVDVQTEALLNETQRRLSETIDRLLANAESIALNRDAIAQLAHMTLREEKTALIKNDLTDNLILLSILGHARLHPREVKVFLSGNTKDFAQSRVRAALREAGIERYFSTTENFLGWLQ